MYTISENEPRPMFSSIKTACDRTPRTTAAVYDLYISQSLTSAPHQWRLITKYPPPDPPALHQGPGEAVHKVQNTGPCDLGGSMPLGGP